MKKITLLLSTLVMLVPCMAYGTAPAQAKQKSTATKSRNYLVPPPPAYTPSFLVDPRSSNSRVISGQGNGTNSNSSSNPYGREVETTASEDSEESTVSKERDKHFYTRDGYQEPKAVKPNRYVTYWNKS